MWRTQYPWAWHVVDPVHTQLEPLFDKTAVPLVCIIDARTMEIFSAATGVPPDIRQQLITASQVVASRPPAY